MVKIKNSLLRIKRLVMGHKRISLVILVAIIILVITFRPKTSVIIATQKIEKGDLVQSLSVTGSINSKNSVNLSFQTGGTLIYLGAKDGNSVKIGQAIVSLDKQKLEAVFRQAQQDFTAAKAASEQYYSGNTNATESYDQKVKRTALDATQNKAYDQMVKAQKDLTDSTLYSPIDGILTRADVETTGVNVTPATVFTVTDPNSIDFEMAIDEADIGNIKEGLPVKVNLDAYPNDTLNLSIDKIAFVYHTTSTGGNAFTIEAKISSNNDNKYKIGMNGNAEIILNEKADVLLIPLSSIFDENKVYVKTKNGYETRILKLGLQNDTSSEVITGLSIGDDIVLDPSLVPQKAKSSVPFIGGS